MYFEDKIRSLTPHHEKMTVLQRSQRMRFELKFTFVGCLLSKTDLEKDFPSEKRDQG